MGFTPNYTLPYPELADSANVPRDNRALAEAVDGLLANGLPHCFAQANTVQAMASSTSALIVYQISAASQAGMFTNGTGNITLPKAGLYQILMSYSWAPFGTAAGSRIVLAGVNGVSTRSWNLGSGGTAALTGVLPWFINANAGDTVQMYQYQSTTPSLSTHNQAYPALVVSRIGSGF